MSQAPLVRTGTAGGTLLVLIVNISIGNLLETGILAAFGAVVSFSVSCILRRLFRSRKP
jgi:hypothetical protein